MSELIKGLLVMAGEIPVAPDDDQFDHETGEPDEPQVVSFALLIRFDSAADLRRAINDQALRFDWPGDTEAP